VVPTPAQAVEHELATPSGVLAICAWLANDALGYEFPSALRDYHPSGHGMLLSEVRDLAQQFGLSTRMSYRQQGAEPNAPAVVHLRVGHCRSRNVARSGRFT
jgi:hypothetical protein